MMGRMRLMAPVLFGFAVASLATPALGLNRFDPEGSGAGYPDNANGRSTDRPTVVAYRLNGAGIKVDGKLDDAPWQEAEAARGFSQADPNRGALPTEQTVFKVAFDEDNIYFAVACFERDVTNTSSSLARRDRIDNSDLISIYIDPYHDRTTGYNFRVNPDGVKADSYMFNDGDRDQDWDAVWDAETYEDSEGWYGEFKIPLSSIRYRADADTWGLQVYRWMHGRGEDNGWVHWDREQRGFVSRFGSMTGISGLKAPRQLEVVPYFVTRTTDPSAQATAEEPDIDNVNGFQNFGADVKYGVTADLTLTATVQPDFGQVEADPALLNLSPFETFFEEKRPFFIEGSRFFQHPDFNLLYSRRIGTGDENSRIRYAGKLIGKTAGDISVATLFAATDVTGTGQAHNFMKGGKEQAYYAVTRLGKEFSEGNHRFNIMQTGVWRDEKLRQTVADSPRRGRDGFTTGADFDLNFRDRTYNIQGSFVGSIVDPAAVGDSLEINHDKRYGTGGALDVRKVAGNYQGGIGGQWEHNRLDPNDIGFLSAPDETIMYAWLQRRFDGDDKDDPYIVNGNLNLNFNRSWLYAGREFEDPENPGEILWSYGRGHRQGTHTNINGWMENKHRWSVWSGIWNNFARFDKFRTRGFEGVRGPLIVNPDATGFWVGFNSDWRKKFKMDSEINAGWIDGGGTEFSWYGGINWVQGSRLNHSLRLGFSDYRTTAQWVENFENPGAGIGGVSYVFGELDQRTVDITLRSNVLFNRDQSLELYVQPFLTVGDYTNPRELARPASYEFTPYSGFDITNRDFSVAAVNLNAVYRWEYRPGSTFFLVWTHARNRDERRVDAGNPAAFDNSFGTSALFQNEPENRILAKITYWFAL